LKNKFLNAEIPSKGKNFLQFLIEDKTYSPNFELAAFKTNLLLEAINMSSYELVQYLLEKSAIAEHLLNFIVPKVFLEVLRASDPKIANLLIEKFGGNHKEQLMKALIYDEHPRGPLLTAIMRNKTELLESFCDVFDEENKDRLIHALLHTRSAPHKLPIEYAMENEKILEIVLRNFNTENRMESLLGVMHDSALLGDFTCTVLNHVKTKCGQEKLMEYIKRQNDGRKAILPGGTLLHLAAKNGDIGMLLFLLQEFDFYQNFHPVFEFVTISDDRNHDATCLAKNYGNNEFARVLNNSVFFKIKIFLYWLFVEKLNWPKERAILMYRFYEPKIVRQ
jgi:hypothetical protein